MGSKKRVFWYLWWRPHFLDLPTSLGNWNLMFFLNFYFNSGQRQSILKDNYSLIDSPQRVEPYIEKYRHLNCLTSLSLPPSRPLHPTFGEGLSRLNDLTGKYPKKCKDLDSLTLSIISLSLLSTVLQIRMELLKKIDSWLVSNLPT